ncbi:MAG: L,D-transpeptidase [Candidatus Dormibacter sp.]|uniref:L,D-transpeptidase n=1 Tax=Candidatus Dormibacter sp. TaxID=2973982 RepID=UPI000DB559F9|nr:MAG: hypothetical protein DLM66_05490 [Candidatus Dormibacteraeota bacterium]
MRKITRIYVLVALNLVALIALGGSLLLTADRESSRAQAQFEQNRARLSAALQQAQAQGYSAADLQPFAGALSGMDHSQAPSWPPARVQFFRSNATTADQLNSQLTVRERQLLESAQSDAANQIKTDQAALANSQAIGVDPADMTPLQQQLDGAVKEQGAAHTITDYRKVSADAQALNNDIATLAANQAKENDAIQTAAADLKGKTAGNLDAIHKAGQDALTEGRNNATAAAYLNKPSPFKGWNAVNSAYAKLEKYAAKLGSGNVDEAAVAAAALQRYNLQIHDGLFSNLPPKAILMQHDAQQLWAYENGQEVRSTQITTGRPALPTDIGPMKVLSKSHPWKMHSPWPKGSPYWYPDTMVQYVLWFTNTGEGLHDAPWQGCCWGPGSENNESLASHGCIHVPYDTEVWMFNWAPEGTPVIFYPGDGSPVQNQLAQITTDDKGNPLSGPGGARGI